MQVDVSSDLVQDIAFSGESCAICRASGSLLTKWAKGKKTTDIMPCDAKFMSDLIGGEIVPGRVKCLLLPLEALKLALASK